MTTENDSPRTTTNENAAQGMPPRWAIKQAQRAHPGVPRESQLIRAWQLYYKKLDAEEKDPTGYA